MARYIHAQHETILTQRKTHEVFTQEEEAMTVFLGAICTQEHWKLILEGAGTFCIQASSVAVLRVEMFNHPKLFVRVYWEYPSPFQTNHQTWQGNNNQTASDLFQRANLIQRMGEIMNTIGDYLLAHGFQMNDPVRESDADYANRICEALPRGAVFTAEDLGTARGADLDAIGKQWNVTRK